MKRWHGVLVVLLLLSAMAAACGGGPTDADGADQGINEAPGEVAPTFAIEDESGDAVPGEVVTPPSGTTNTQP